MHGLINCAIQRFIRETYGKQAWADICREAGLGFEAFESMLVYKIDQTEAVLLAICKMLGFERAALLEEIGKHLVADPNQDHLKRLLRFGGETFREFLHSLDNLHDLARLALPDLDFPVLEVKEHSPAVFELSYQWDKHGFGAAIGGILDVMAVDYGVLVSLDHKCRQTEQGDFGTILINVLDADYARSHELDLAVEF